MRIVFTSIFVPDQDAAREFYVDVLGFRVKTDIPMGDVSWLTVVSPEDPDGPEIVLEPEGHPAVGPYKKALFDDGIPMNTFEVSDVRAEHRRLDAAGVRFTVEPQELPDGMVRAVFDDGFGNLLQIHQVAPDTDSAA
ncbi:VOC family protein [uncultured Corynebacterium sp.]|uniref:VOC family protein n=1 Tax=uncultured Corynebacterium sp. TaxID=159447 RepID=UPI0025D93A9B|nr:VOC family protein [uncultured Corynebacterium sp.]